jgi:uncharacterized protein DUF6262
MADRHSGLARAAARKHDHAHERAVDAIRRLVRAGETITFKAVAAAAGVARQWLYTQPDLREEIERLRTPRAGTAARVPPAQRASEESLHQRLEMLLDENRRLRAELGVLNAELSLALGRARGHRS